MRPFTVHTGVAAPLLHNNIDTDAIIPSREMKRVSKQGLGEGLFAGWRYTLPGGREPNPDFVLNKPEYAGTSILLAGENFGCGSSREHAVWALGEFGIRAVIAPSFGSIFHSNCVRNGILPITLEESDVHALAGSIKRDPRLLMLQINLPEQFVQSHDKKVYGFIVDGGHKSMLLNGFDGIDLTLQHLDDIAAFEATDRQSRPWIYR